MVENIILEYNIYEDKELLHFVKELESRYNIKDEIEYFKELVNFSKNKDVPYHRWFKYREGFSHDLIKELIKRSNISKDQYVLDPFCGAGTTVVEALRNGYSALGLDINPMSAFISKVKCTPYTEKDIKKFHEVYDKFIDYVYKCDIKDINTCNRYEEVRKYFSDNNFNQLLSIKDFIDNIKFEKKIRNLFMCAYLCIIEEVSDRKRDGNGLRKSISKVSNVYEYYTEKLNEIIYDITNYRIDINLNADVICGNAMDLEEHVKKFESAITSKVGAIMYSPPYANSFDYFESYKLEITLGDFVGDLKEINSYRVKAIESFIGRNDEREESFDFVNKVATEIQNAIPVKEAKTGKRDSRTRKVPKMIKGYFSDMAKVIEQSSNILSKGQKCYIVVDQSSYLGKIVPTDLFLAYIGEKYGFKINEILVCRRARTSGQQLQRYPYLKDILRESIVILEKS